MKQFKQMVAQGERGQAIVLIALFMVVMLAMVGVAIDGGGLFWLWRNAQNAADSAALQAAFDRCTGASGTTWQEVGLDAAEVNGFDDNGTDNWVTVDDNGGTAYTRVEIIAHKPKYFIQLVYTGTLEVRAEAMVYCTKAIDFSNLPGAIGLGDCSCPSNIPPSDFDSGGENSVDMAGSNQTVIGGMFSNCDLDVTGSTSNWTEGGPQAANEVDINSDATGDEAEPDSTGVEADPLSLNIAMYMPSGTIFQSVQHAYAIDVDDSDTGLDASYTGGTNQNVWNPGAGSCSGSMCDEGSGLTIPVEGLFYVDGNVDLSWLDEDEWYGDPSVPGQGEDDWKGITVVASGSITMPDPNEVTWKFYGYNDEVTDDAGVAAEFSNGQWPFLLAYSNYDNNQAPCNVNAASAALNLSGQDADDSLDLWGVLYAPRGYLHWSGNHKQGQGAIVVLKIDWQGSDTTWEFDPTVLPPRAPTMNNVQ
jgi:hypothetical protein